MPGTTAAKRYAKALLALATEQDIQEQVGSELSQIAEALADPAVAKILALPTLPLKTRKEIVKQFVTTLSPQLLMSNFLHVLAENDRLSALSDIENAYQRLLERALGRVRAQILSATPLSETELEQLVGAFSRLTNRTVVPTVEVNPDLLGGMMVEIEGRVYDASLRTQLRRLGDTLAQQI